MVPVTIKQAQSSLSMSRFYARWGIEKAVASDRSKRSEEELKDLDLIIMAPYVEATLPRRQAQ